MSDTITQLLTLQDCDKKILRYTKERHVCGATRANLTEKLEQTQQELIQTKKDLRSLESERDRIDVEIQSKKDQISKYLNQQLQTKKNDEYQALGREIETANARIDDLETKELETMERIDAKKIALEDAQVVADKLRKDVEVEIAEVDKRESFLNKTLKDLDEERARLAKSTEEKALRKYEHLIKKKPGAALAGIDRGVCDGCHMQIPSHAIISTKKGEELVNCPNCGRLLYYTRDMRAPGEV